METTIMGIDRAPLQKGIYGSKVMRDLGHTPYGACLSGFNEVFNLSKGAP